MNASDIFIAKYVQSTGFKIVVTDQQIWHWQKFQNGFSYPIFVEYSN